MIETKMFTDSIESCHNYGVFYSFDAVMKVFNDPKVQLISIILMCGTNNISCEVLRCNLIWLEIKRKMVQIELNNAKKGNIIFKFIQ